MTTPPNLKRKSPTLLSTLDRTIRTKHTLSDVVPSFYSPTTAPSRYVSRDVIPKQLVSSFESTTDLEEKIHKLIEADNEASEILDQKGIRNKAYIDCLGNFKLIKGDFWVFPEQVSELFKKM